MTIPDGLAPGAATDITLRGIPMRATAGEWLLKLDINLPAGDALSKHGVVGPQLRIRTVAP